MKRIVFLLIIALSSCKSSQSFYQIENEGIVFCKDKWKIESLTENISIRLLLQDPKGKYDLSSWPNLFIGTTNLVDTVSTISYETDAIFDKGIVLSFTSSRIRNLPLDELS